MKFATYLALVGAAAAQERCKKAADCEDGACGWLVWDGVEKPPQSYFTTNDFLIKAYGFSTLYKLDPRETFAAADTSAVTEAEWAAAMAKMTAGSSATERYCGETSECNSPEAAEKALKAEGVDIKGVTTACDGVTIADVDGGVDTVSDAANCAADNLLDPEGLEECLKWAGKDCADEDVVPADDKEACEAAQASAKALAAGALALVAAAALM